MRKHIDVDRVKLDTRDYKVTCLQCGNVFESTRSDSAFCGSTCRSRHARQQKNRQREIDRLKQQLEKVLNNMPGMGKSPEFDALDWVLRRVSKAVNNVESK